MKLDQIHEVVSLRTELIRIDRELEEHNNPENVKACKVTFAKDYDSFYFGVRPSPVVSAAILALVIADLMNSRKAIVASLTALGIEVDA